MPLIRWAPLPQCWPPPDTEKFGVPNAAANVWNGTRLAVTVVVRWTTSLRGSSARTFFSTALISSSASSQLISFHFGSSFKPFFGLVRRSGRVRRLGS